MRIFEQVRRWQALIWLLLFCICVALKLNGSSVGMWEEELSGHESVKGLLLFKPQPIRTDEWLVWTPAALCQARQNPPFPPENPNLGPGRAPLLLNLPIAYYTTWFRPQLWGFFILDFERGFSFCWFAKVFGLILAVAWLLQQLRVRYSLALFGGMWTLLALQWWLSSPTMLPEMIASWAICIGCAIQLFTQRKPWWLATAFAALIYFGANFILCCYPPAQIPLVYLMLAIVIGCVLERRQLGEFCAAKRGTLLLVGAIAVIALVLLRCWIDIRPTLDLVSHTAYPGSRRTSGGGYSIFNLFSGWGAFFLTQKALPAAYPNLTVANHIYPAWLAVLVVIIIARFRRGTAISPLLVAITILTVGVGLYCVVPFPAWLIRSTLLAFSTEHSSRLAIGLGNVILTCLFLERYRVALPSTRGAIGATAIFSFAIAVLFWTASWHQPNFFPDKLQLVLSFLAGTILVALLFRDRWRSLFPILLLLLMILTNGRINPLMHGLSPLLESESFQAVEKIHKSDPTAKWMVYNDLAVPELVKATGARVLNGFKIVPDLDFLHRFDPDHRADFVYNRYGHVVCELPEYPGEIAFRFVAADYYVLFVSPGDFAVRELGCRYVVLPDPWPEAGLHGFTLLQEIPSEHMYVYILQ